MISVPVSCIECIKRSSIRFLWLLSLFPSRMFWKLALPAILACTLCASMETKKPRPRGSIPSPYKLKGNELMSSSSIMLSSLPQQPSSKRHKGKQEVLLSSQEALVVTERKYLKSDWCKTQPLRQTVSLEGCVSQTIINHFCYGQCNSFYIPRHLAPGNGRQGRKRAAKSNHGASFQSCAFCKPHRISTLTVRLHCPRLQPTYRHRKVQRIKECRCMSVSVNETHWPKGGSSQMVLNTTNNLSLFLLLWIDML